MTPDELAHYAASLPGLKKKGTPARPAWYVDDRLVVRLEDPTTLTIRCAFDAREELTRTHPDTFGVPPRFERHEKVQADLTHGHDPALRDAIRAAYELQKRR